jgi:predicted TPR repeat methyltransferase
MNSNAIVTINKQRTRLVFVLFAILVYSSCAATTTNEDTPGALFHRTVRAWRSTSHRNDWSPWTDFAKELHVRFQNSVDKRLEIVGALEEGVLIIEQSIFKNGEGENPIRDAALSQLYFVYANTLSNLNPEECLELALDPHTLLIGADTIDRQSKPDTHICIENAENSLRNAATLDATNVEAERLLQNLTGDDSTLHKRKPKEFVAELFDSFADTFDEKLLTDLQYKVPTLVGDLAKNLSMDSIYNTVLDAGCGTGLAGRYLRPLVNAEKGRIIGVDASRGMLDIASKCTTSSGCGLENNEGDNNNKAEQDRPLYDALLKMDLEEMTVSNTLHNVVADDPDPDGDTTKAFDLIVAADVLVYFGSLEKLLERFAQLSKKGAHLIFSCELATEELAPLGWRLLASGRFAHTKRHAVEAAEKVGYSIVHYEEIVPRMEKGEPVRGHLFGFELEKGRHARGDEL